MSGVGNLSYIVVWDSPSMDDGGFRGLYRGVLDFAMAHIGYVMGLVMILYAIFGIILDIKYNSLGVHTGCQPGPAPVQCGL